MQDSIPARMPSIAAGNYSSRFAGATAGAAHIAATRLKVRLAHVAAAQLNLRPEDQCFAGGRVFATPASVDRRAFTIVEPIGVVAAISAFNHPLNLIVHQVVPAVATGCPVIVKPANPMPLSCLELVGLLHNAGLPPEWCQVFLPETNDLAEALATDPRVAFLSFIGSGRVGWHLRSKLPSGTRCAL